jgi:hypothetical protein
MSRLLRLGVDSGDQEPPDPRGTLANNDETIFVRASEEAENGMQVLLRAGTRMAL